MHELIDVVPIRTRHLCRADY